MDKPKGIFLAIISPLSSGVATVLQKAVLTEFGIILTASLLKVFGGTVVLLVALFRPGNFAAEELIKSRWLMIRVACVRGLGHVLFLLGLYYTDAIKAVFFTKIEPYFVLFWCWVLLGERISRKEVGLLLIHIFGAFLLSTGGNFATISTRQLGDLFIVLAMFVSGYSYLESRTLSLKIGALRAAGLSSLLTGVILLPFALIFSGHLLPAVDMSAWLMLAGVVILFDVISLTAWFASLESVPGWLVSALRVLGPLAGVPAAFIMFGETLSAMQTVGGLVVLGTSAWMVVQHRRRTE